MKILVFEWLTGGGLRADNEPVSPQFHSGHGGAGECTANYQDPAGSLLRQGATMAFAAAEDLAGQGHQILLPVDERLIDSLSPQTTPREFVRGMSDLVDTQRGLKARICQKESVELAGDLREGVGRHDLSGIEFVSIDSPLGSPSELARQLCSIAARVDRVMLIAPETGGRLARTLRWIQDMDPAPPLISPDLSFVTRTSDKKSLVHWLRNRGFLNLPAQWTSLEFDHLVEHGANESAVGTRWPVVLKPIDGAGSESTWLVADRSRWRELYSSLDDPGNFFVEEYVIGESISVSVVGRYKESGEYSPSICPPTKQIFDRQPSSKQPRFGHYVSAGIPIDHETARRATALAEKLVAILPATIGYFGIDMIIAKQRGSAAEQHDRVIEVNPRLTMSYLTLRDLELSFSLYPSIGSGDGLGDRA